MVFFFRCRFVAVSYFLKFGLLVLGYRIFPCFLLFRFGKFHYMVYRNLALYGLAYLYLTFGIVMDGLPINLSVREAVATAFLHIVQNVRDAIVYVLGWVSVTFCKEFIFRCSLLQNICMVRLKWSVVFISSIVLISYTFSRFQETRTCWLRNFPQNIPRCIDISYRHGTT